MTDTDNPCNTEAGQITESVNEPPSSHNIESGLTVPTPLNQLKLHDFVSNIKLPPTWNIHLLQGMLQLCKVAHIPCSSNNPVVITHCIIVKEDFTWELFIHGHKLRDFSKISSSIPCHLNATFLKEMLHMLEKLHVCPGNPDERFVSMGVAHKGIFPSSSGGVRARVEENFPVTCGGKVYSTTVRLNLCALLVNEDKCKLCKEYRPQLRAAYSRWSKKTNTPIKFANNTPQKEKKTEESTNQGKHC